jgi:hypothetical protein
MSNNSTGHVLTLNGNKVFGAFINITADAPFTAEQLIEAIRIAENVEISVFQKSTKSSNAVLALLGKEDDDVPF